VAHPGIGGPTVPLTDLLALAPAELAAAGLDPDATVAPPLSHRSGPILYPPEGALRAKTLIFALQTSSYCLVTRAQLAARGASAAPATRSWPAALSAGPPLHADGGALAATLPGTPAQLGDCTPRPTWPYGRPPTPRRGDRPVATHPMRWRPTWSGHVAWFSRRLDVLQPCPSNP
jgi:hypothetical protein